MISNIIINYIAMYANTYVHTFIHTDTHTYRILLYLYSFEVYLHTIICVTK